MPDRVRRTHPYKPERDLRWQEHAACAQAPLGLFFPDQPDGPPVSWASLSDYVRKVNEDYCQECPVRSACLNHALTEPELYGIWAGTTPPQRQARAQEARTA